MSKARDVLSDNQLIEYSREHVLHEIDMLVKCEQLLTSGFRSEFEDAARVFRNAVIESFAIHVRNLVDFLYPTNVQPTDVLADDFFPEGKRPVNFPLLPPELKTARTRAHKQVSHLTTERLSGAHPEKKWPAPELVREIMKILL